MPPSVARARRPEQITSTARTQCLQSISRVCSFPLFFVFHIVSLRSHAYSMISSMHWFMFSTDFPNTKSKMPSTSAAMAVHILRSTAILLILIHLSLSTPLITTPYQFLPYGFVLPSQNPRNAFQFAVLNPFSIVMVLCTSAPRFGNCSPIDPFFSHIAVSTHVDRRTVRAGGNRLAWWSQCPRLFTFLVFVLLLGMFQCGVASFPFHSGSTFHKICIATFEPEPRCFNASLTDASRRWKGGYPQHVRKVA